jgi:hypothetical protein
VTAAHGEIGHDGMDQIAADKYAVLRANKFVLQIVTDARAPVNSLEERQRRVCDAYFSLWTAVSAYWTPLVIELGMVPGYAWCPPRSPVDACALVLREWSAKLPGLVNELQFTGLLHDMLYSLKVDSAISADLMDACVGALSTMLDGEVFILQYRYVLPVMEVLKAVWITENFSAGAEIWFRSDTLLQHSRLAARSLQRFQDFCALHEKATDSIVKVVNVLTTKLPARIVFPLMIECEPVNGKPGVENWVAVE